MNIKKLTYLGVYTSLALIFSYVESLIAFPIPIPGFKLGIANSVILFILLNFSYKEALIVGIIRILLSFFMFGNFYSLILSLAGFIFSLFVMSLLKYTHRFSEYGISISGAIFHNAGQIFACIFICNITGLLFYLSVLSFVSLFTGTINALLAKRIYKRVGYDWIS